LDLGEKTAPALVVNRKRGSGNARKVADDYDGLAVKAAIRSMDETNGS
jgi:hypothetical protein